MIIRELTEDDPKYLADAYELLSRTQGRGLIKEDYLIRVINNPEGNVIAAIENDQLVGVGVAVIINEYDFYKPFDPGIIEKLQGHKVGSFSTLSVVENRQAQGIGKKISQARLKWLKDMGCDVVVGVSWVSGLKNTSDRVFEKMGFTAIKKIDNFFVEMWNERRFDCPGCHQKPCSCSAIFYMWKNS